MPEALRDDYAAEQFGGLKVDECDLVMKGGITSGIVYPFAILELGRKYRFRSIGGTSAGAIAAAFAAAAEYSRQAGDPGGFIRFKARCESLPGLMLGLFQPTASLKGLMTFLLRSQSSGWISALMVFWLPLLAGVLVGGGLLWLLGGGWAGTILGVIVGFVAALAWRLLSLLALIPKNGFGICTGLTQPGYDHPALTDWIYQSLQEIAFGPAGRDKPLTFGDLANINRAKPTDEATITLRAVTTDLSMGRPRSLPDLGEGFRFVEAEWRRLFPKVVVDYLLGLDSTKPEADAPDWDRLPRFPAADDLPAIIAVRMSLSFPVLFTAVPLRFLDLSLIKLADDQKGTIDPIDIPDPKAVVSPVWFTDGGVTSNFPIQFFDALLPGRPTFALSLDQLAPGMEPGGGRVYLPHHAWGGSFTTVDSITALFDFGHKVFNAAQNWQDSMMSVMGAQRERVARVYLAPDEGGMNLSMPPALSRKLMGFGQVAGRKIVAEFDFEEHRWRRALVAYEKMQEELRRTNHIWTRGGYGPWLESYLPNVESYKELPLRDRKRVHARLGDMATAAKAFEPPIIPKKGQFPRPPGSLRISPKI